MFIRKAIPPMLLIGSFTLGVWAAAWAECVAGYNNCGYVPPDTKIKRTTNHCVQDSGPPNCICCEYYARYYDLNSDGATDCVIVQTISHIGGTWGCDSTGIGCLLDMCGPTPTPTPSPNPGPG